MDQPPPDQPPPDISVVPPKLNQRSLWLSLLLPGLLTALGMLALLFIGKNAELVLNIGTVIVLTTAIACWIAYILCLSKRFVGPSLILLILAYPVVQAILIFGIFFAGCLALVAKDGIH